MRAIYKKELRLLFQNVLGFLFIGISLALYGLFFFAYNISYGYPSIAYPLAGMRFLMVFTIPMLCMRSFSEEKKHKTDQLLFTAPVSAGRIVLAKYLSLATVFSIVTAVIALSPVFLSFFGNVSFPENYTALLGYWLYGLTLIAIASFASALTESQMIAAILGVVFLFAGYMMSSVTSLLSSSGNLLTKILNAYDLNAALDDFLSGSLSFTGMLYYVSILLLMLFLTCQVLLKKRFVFSKLRLGTAMYGTASVVFAVVLCVAVNIIAGHIPENLKSMDVTERKIYSLTDTTKEFLKTLDRDITIDVYAAEANADETLKKTLAHYEAQSPHIQVTYTDPTENPSLATAGSSYLAENSLTISDGTRSKEIPYADIYQSEMDYNTYSQVTTGYDGEGQITSAIAWLMTEDMPVIVQLTGHGESELDSGYRMMIEKLNYEVETLNLLDTDAIVDAAAVVIGGPESDYSKEDIAKLRDYLADGGKMIVELNCVATEAMPNLTAFLAEYGVTVVPGLVRDADDGFHYGMSEYYLFPAIEAHEVTVDLPSYVFVPDAAGLTYETETDEEDAADADESDAEEAEATDETEADEGDDEDTSDKTDTGDTEDKTTDDDTKETDEKDSDDTEVSLSDLTILPILTTSDSAESVKLTEDEDGRMMASEEVSAEGPFYLGLSVGIGSETPDLFVYSSMEMFSDAADELIAGTNRQLFKNTLLDLSEEDESRSIISVDVKQYSDEYVVFTASAVILYGILWSIVFPLLLIISGIAIFIVRRIRK